MSVENLCSHCNGSGMVHGQECEMCFGEGILEGGNYVDSAPKIKKFKDFKSEGQTPNENTSKRKKQQSKKEMRKEKTDRKYN